MIVIVRAAVPLGMMIIGLIIRSAATMIGRVAEGGSLQLPAESFRRRFLCCSGEDRAAVKKETQAPQQNIFLHVRHLISSHFILKCRREKALAEILRPAFFLSHDACGIEGGEGLAVEKTALSRHGSQFLDGEGGHRYEFVFIAVLPRLHQVPSLI